MFKSTAVIWTAGKWKVEKKKHHSGRAARTNKYIHTRSFEQFTRFSERSPELFVALSIWLYTSKRIHGRLRCEWKQHRVSIFVSTSRQLEKSWIHVKNTKRAVLGSGWHDAIVDTFASHWTLETIIKTLKQSLYTYTHLFFINCLECDYNYNDSNRF